MSAFPQGPGWSGASGAGYCAGYTCWRCGTFIPNGCTHSCWNYVGPFTPALQAQTDPLIAPMWLPWHADGRVIYAQVGDAPSDGDRLIGVMDTPELADEAARSHNATLKAAQS